MSELGRAGEPSVRPAPSSSAPSSSAPTKLAPSRVLFVSKPVAPPFHDGSQVLVKELAASLPTWRARICTSLGEGAWTETLGADAFSVYPNAGRFAPALLNNAVLAAALAVDRASDVWHFVFAPNPRTCFVANSLKRLRGIPTVQTVASPPRNFEGVDDLLFGDVVVAQSEWTKRKLQAALTKERNIALLRPPLGITPTPNPPEMVALRERLQVAPDTRLLVYPGDLEFSGGAQRVAALVEAQPDLDAVFVFACRKKTEAAVEVERELQRRLAGKRVRFAGELPSLLPLLKAASVVLFPVEDLFAKVDTPIALLEAMDLGVPLLLADSGPAAELRGALRAPLNDIAAWNAALTALLNDTSQRQAVVTIQREHIENEFRAKVVAARYEALYQSLCSR